MTFRVGKTDFKQLSDEVIDSFIEHYNLIHKEDLPTFPVPNKDLTMEFMTKQSPYRAYRRWLIHNDENICIGYAYLIHVTDKYPTYESDKHIGNIHISLNKQYRRQGIGTRVLNIIIEEAKKYGITTLQIWTPNKDGKEAGKHWNGTMAHEHYVNQLFLHDVDWGLMNEWIEQSKTKANDVEIQLFFEVPEDRIEEFVILHSETENQAPWGGEGTNVLTPEMRREYEKENRDKGTKWITMITKEKSGEISGLTEIRYNPKEPKAVRQDLTGVREIYRGRGLGKRLKAEMLIHINENYPAAEFISTGNAKLNEAILSLNQAIGYKEVAVFNLYQIKI